MFMPKRFTKAILFFVSSMDHTRWTVYLSQQPTSRHHVYYGDDLIGLRVDNYAIDGEEYPRTSSNQRNESVMWAKRLNIVFKTDKFHVRDKVITHQLTENASIDDVDESDDQMQYG